MRVALVRDERSGAYGDATTGCRITWPLSGIVVSANVRMRLMKTAAARSAFVNWSDCETRFIAPEGERARVERVALASRPRGGRSDGTRARVSITHTYIQACNLISCLGTRRDKPGIYGCPRRMERRIDVI